MARNQHIAPLEARSDWEVHQLERGIDLNHASIDQLAVLPMVSHKGADDLMRHRPFMCWGDVERVPGFDKDMVDEMRSCGAHL